MTDIISIPRNPSSPMMNWTDLELKVIQEYGDARAANAKPIKSVIRDSEITEFDNGSVQLWLYEHDDGRYAVAPVKSSFLHDDPLWGRVGPVEVQGAIARTKPVEAGAEALTLAEIEAAFIKAGCVWISQGRHWCIEEEGIRPLVRAILASHKRG